MTLFSDKKLLEKWLIYLIDKTLSSINNISKIIVNTKSA